tara:strand:+ start:1012 stop:2115 length:1104 start_codon:yes stop_codon:yes gene_type:complete
MKVNLKWLVLSAVVISLSACTVGRFFVYNFANITDHKIFPSRTLTKSDQAFQFKKRAELRIPKNFKIDGKEVDFDDYLEKNKTVAFLVIKNDTIKYEQYYNKYDESSIVASFSMAKSVTSMLVGFAIQDGFIESEEDLVTKYVPELKERGFDKVSLKHLLQMTSGMEFNESYVNPFGHAAKYYYGRNLRKQLTKAKLDGIPGTYFEYQSGQTQLLGLALERALNEKSITSYLQEKLWTPLGMEYDASWSLDRKKDGLEKTFCCLNARALDFAKLGRFYLNKGNWSGKQLLNEDWIEQSTKRDTIDGSAVSYQYQWWLKGSEGDYAARGILGQYIYVHPEKNIIIVRLGKTYGNTSWTSIFKALAKAY